MGIDDAEMGEFAYDYVGFDAAASHAYRDDTHSHGDVPVPSGGREPRHIHMHTVSVVPKDAKEGSMESDEKENHNTTTA